MTKKTRRYDLVWLRVLAVLLLVPFHVKLVFDMDPRSILYMKDTVNSKVLTTFAGFVQVWHMPILFFIAGASSWYALGSRRPGEYVRERTLRLLVPFVFGVITLLPLMTYVHFIGQPGAPTFWGHCLTFFTIAGNSAAPSSFLTGIRGGFTPAHLWFIILLFIYSMLALPLFMWLRRPAGGRWPEL